MKLRNLIIVLLIIVVAVVLVACGEDNPTDTTTPTTTAATTTAQTTAATTAQTTAATTAQTTAAPITTAAPANVFENFEKALSLTKPASKTPAASYTVWDGTVATAFAGGTGTEADPYLISNGAQLAYLAFLANSDGFLTVGKYYKLTADIYLNNVANWTTWNENTAPANVWMPIGVKAGNTASCRTEFYFGGTFDGAGKTVFGIYTSKEGYYGGLFGNTNGIDGGAVTALDNCLPENCTTVIKNLSISHSDINAYYYAGAILGLAYDGVLVQDCIVTDTKVETRPKADLQGSVGGVAGRTELACFIRCHTTATCIANITMLTETGAWAQGYFAGGFASVLSGYAEECSAWGDVRGGHNVGGFIGYMGASSRPTRVLNCASHGTVGTSWDYVDTSVVPRKNCTYLGIFTAKSAHVDSFPLINIEYCVTSGKFDPNLNFEGVTNLGVFAGAHTTISDVKGALYVKDGVEDVPPVANWETAAQYYWTETYGVTRAEYDAYVAQLLSK